MKSFFPKNPLKFRKGGEETKIKWTEGGIKANPRIKSRISFKWKGACRAPRVERSGSLEKTERKDVGRRRGQEGAKIRYWKLGGKFRGDEMVCRSAKRKEPPKQEGGLLFCSPILENEKVS